MSEGHTERLEAALDGKYRIERKLGEGGMASVYLAEDIKHERKVALKILRPELAAVLGAERFLSEIKTTAKLQHPHILALHDSGEAEGYLYYVMPYIDGETLREKLDREKQLGVEEAVRIARDVADALDYAHRAGVIHRDIKPGNILLHDGRPVVADFGIALAVSAAGGGRMTETGLSLGTPHYMSPEQASADRDLSARSDVYSLGCVLYEMIAGQPPHTGPSAQSILVRIMTKEATPLSELRHTVPPHVAATVSKAIEKLPADRFETAKDFMGALGDEGFTYQARPRTTTGTPASVAAQSLPIRRWHQDRRVVSSLIVTAAMTAVAAWGWLRPEAAPPVVRVSLDFPEDQGVTGFGSFSLSVDGSLLVYSGPGTEQGTTSQFWVRRWDALDATPIRDAGALGSHAISPDGREISISINGQAIRVVPIDGGVPRSVAPNSVFCCGSWSPDGAWLYFTDSAFGISRVPAAGGAVEIVTRADTTAARSVHLFPDVLPGGRTLVFTFRTPERGVVFAADIESGELVELTAGQFPRYSQGHLLFTDPDDGTTLFAQPFDPGRVEFSGAATPIAEGLRGAQGGWSFYTVSPSGSLLYATGVPAATEAEPIWVTRSGEAELVDPDWRFDAGIGGAGSYGWHLSPDGGRVAVTRVVGENADIWIKELPDEPFTRLTFDDRFETSPFWSPDGDFVAYQLGGQIWQRRADGTGDPEPLVSDNPNQGGWSPDGEWIVGRGNDILGYRPGADSVATALVASEFDERGPALSADGRWLAYSSDQSGREEVYVRPFPDVDAGREQVSVGGGSNPVWARSGGELFYLDPNRNMIAAQVETASGFQVLEREVLFALQPEYIGYSTGDGGDDLYDVAPDGRFLIGRLVGGVAPEGGQRHILVQNWVEELRRRSGGN